MASQGSLEVRVISATNINPEKIKDLDVYVKVEMRGQVDLVKARTAIGKWQEDGSLKFDEILTLPVPPGAEEIRLKVCKDKKRLALSSSNAVCNAGIYLRDLLRFVPIEKDFGLFRPTDKTAGGTIKMFFDFKPATTKGTPASTDARAKPMEVKTPSERGVAYAPAPAQKIARPTEPPASTMKDVKTHKTRSTPATERSSAEAGKKFPLIGLILAAAGIFGAAQIRKKRPAQQQLYY
mmetsp:Transcript_900/g.1590  ORF Transcript_900/g.1590 Transcript_900/m.1590 type:complete len:237 (+) Transcript_900:131-841(+)|eukprot:CAMPEP_0198211684 /NCGR_PEP_ID=MMETSP1445-20131203/25121_1 /TAXON_ID=36898 /ORGANISM="Pyramimonas sp., Strain CCMP2087" /LENGTH=236 /DNA_ID=CAMNT_0043886005 /DNA_START=131 /DNA_END=841 /DNA_ORIENTATION=-